jgi:hypothetical protein
MFSATQSLSFNSSQFLKTNFPLNFTAVKYANKNSHTTCN